MGYNLAKHRMKKITIVFVLMAACLSFSSFKSVNSKGSSSMTIIDFKSTYHVEAELRNEAYNQQLYLYSDGSCVIRTEDGRGTGTYDIKGDKIYFTWDNGYTQQGSVTRENGKVKSVSVEGITYSSKREVVKRR